MKKLMTLILILTFTIATSSCHKSIFSSPYNNCTGNMTLNPDHPMKDSLTAIINRSIANGLPGVQVVVKNNDGWFFATGGFAKTETRKPFQVCTPSWQFSITKTFTATLIMKMKERNKVKLDEKIATYLSQDVLSNIAGYQKITVRMLLNHSSGIADFTVLPEFLEWQFTKPLQQPSISERIHMLKEQPSHFEPGTDFEYCNSNYLLLHLILEKVSGKNYEELLKNEILKPLNLRHTWYNLPEEKTVSLGFPNYYFDRNGEGQLENITSWNTALANACNGYGGIGATPEDIINFYQSLLKGNVVSQQSLAAMKTWFTGKESTQPDYGLGIEYYNYSTGSSAQYGHEGDGLGCSTQILYVPANNTFIYINTNAGRKIPGPYLFKVTDMKNELCRYVANYR